VAANKITIAAPGGMWRINNLAKKACNRKRERRKRQGEAAKAAKNWRRRHEETSMNEISSNENDIKQA